MTAIYLNERETKECFLIIKELEVLVSEIMKENKAYKKENERLKKYEELYLNHRAEVDSD